MRALDRKAWRDIWHMRGPAIAVAIVTACGVASFVLMRSMVHHLGDTQREYYAASRFGDLFAQVKRAPAHLLGEIAALPGVEAADGWVSGEVVLDVPGLTEPASGKVVGMLPDSPGRLNRVTIERGRAPAQGSRDEAVLSEGFAKANRFALGDTLGAVLNGRWRRLRVVGVGTSPEYIYELRPGDIFPDNKRYGVIWMDAGVVSDDFGMTGEWNGLAVRLTPGASSREVIARLDAMLERYGTLGAFDRERQVSHRFVSEEINQNRTSANVIPAIFLGVTAFLLNLVLSRIVATQREQIGMLKAFGCGERALARHYLLIALVPVTLGAALGVGFGLWGAYGAARLYQDFYRFPNMRFHPYPWVAVQGAAVAIVAAVVGAVSAVRRVSRLAPAESMRPEAPLAYRQGALERLRLDRALGPAGRMTARALLRRPVRASLSVLGVALGASVIVVGSFMYDAIDRMRDVQFDSAFREDVAVSFTTTHDDAVLRELARLPGVTRVEPVRDLAVRVRHRQHERLVGLVAIDPAATLRRAVDERGVPLAEPGGGIALNRALATLLEAKLGDSVVVEPMEGRRTPRTFAVTAIDDDLIGTTAYAGLATFAEIAAAPEHVTGASLAVSRGERRALYDRLKRTPGVAGVAVRSAMLDAFDATVRDAFAVTLGTLILFATALAAGVVYNTMRIALSERGRELASLRVLGFTRGEVARLLFSEQFAVTVAAMPVGAALGALFSWGMVQAMGTTELWRLPFVISTETYLQSSAVIALAALGSALLVRGRLDQLDLVGVLKTRE